MTEPEDLEAEIKTVDQELSTVEKEIAKWKNRQRKLHERKTFLKIEIDKRKSMQLASVDWGGTDYEWSAKVRELLESVFKINSFRPKQLSAINSTLSGQHALVVMPTGAGKSLCYQLPALVRPGITVVVSPLVSLMEDQVRALRSKNIPAKLITSTTSKDETSGALNDLKDKSSDTKLLYATPERFAKSKRFMANLQKCFTDGRLQRIAIDEVHCCSQWGHDFRPDFKYLGILANMFPGVPLLGLTATATSSVLTDVQKILNIRGCLLIKSTFNRPNLFYKILEKPSSLEDCLDILEKLMRYRYKDDTGIIYTNTIKDCEDIAGGLKARGLAVGCYHASVDATRRSAIHTKWHNKHYQAIVATIAFGMGIDKPDVRFVIHHTMSRSMENYYQESGRAGRDGERAECITLYRMQDMFKVSTIVFSSVGSLDHLYGMLKYCLNGHQCRRQVIAEHFDEDWGTSDCNQMCDVCRHSTRSTREIRLEGHCKTLASIIDNADKLDTKLTAQKLLDAWFLKGPVNLRSKCKEPGISRTLGEDVVAHLLVEGYLVEDFHFTAYSTISYLKKGPNMEALYDQSFTLMMKVRSYTSFDLECPAPDDFQVKCAVVDDQPKSRKTKASDSSGREKCVKKIKTIVLD